MILFVEIPRTLFPIVVIPVVNTSPSGLSVIPDPTRVFDLNVAIPATSKIPVLTFAVLIPTPFISLNDVAVIIPTALIPDSLTVTAEPTNV